ncbi:putative transmembrane protein [Candidatus Burkholderia verschuerenii]|uniref:Putative transmembrane protein n=1 Tax=Candidatus Burkholderia verschuerenii TaxID=242163 RepID=A0A0L0MBN6_9BURK|nr:HPP family protein [Candidatus Burkholderia verschuerenii]KND59686.1 putative transmembrane protein [Candidatus Burkholderia verschuerenii]
MSRNALLRWLRAFVPAPVTLKWTERLRAGLGASIGIAHLVVGDASVLPFLIAPMGASAVLLFAVPASPLAQPWSIVGGNLVSATVGVACAMLVRDPVDAAALAIGVAICAMFALRCVHPPSGAVALTVVLGGPSIHALGFGFVFAPVALQSAVLLASAIAYHALTGHRYPHGHAAPKSAAPDATSFLRADLEAVLARRSELLDVDPDDLEALLRETQLQAYARRFTEFTCADIMSRAVVPVAPKTSADAALSLLDRHRVKALPVIDASRRLRGIVTRADLAHAYSSKTFDAWKRGIARLFDGPRHGPPRIAALMTVDVRSVDMSVPIAELVPMFAHFGHHHIPVIDADHRLVGMITEADLISGLYRQSFDRAQRSA